MRFGVEDFGSGGLGLAAGGVWGTDAAGTVCCPEGRGDLARPICG